MKETLEVRCVECGEWQTARGGAPVLLTLVTDPNYPDVIVCADCEWNAQEDAKSFAEDMEKERMRGVI